MTVNSFVDAVVHDFENQVVQSRLIRVANVHRGALTDALNAFQVANIVRAVFAGRTFWLLLAAAVCCFVSTQLTAP